VRPFGDRVIANQYPKSRKPRTRPEAKSTETAGEHRNQKKTIGNDRIVHSREPEDEPVVRVPGVKQTSEFVPVFAVTESCVEKEAGWAFFF
jgi:hypothetical protein